MPGPVTEYRAYIVGGDGHISSVRVFVCDTDDEAIAWATQLVGEGHGVELWSGDRFIVRLPAQAPDIS
jgi:hypothetical protein